MVSWFALEAGQGILGSLIGKGNQKLAEMTAAEINRFKGSSPYKHYVFIILHSLPRIPSNLYCFQVCKVAFTSAGALSELNTNRCRHVLGYFAFR